VYGPLQPCDVAGGRKQGRRQVGGGGLDPLDDRIGKIPGKIRLLQVADVWLSVVSKSLQKQALTSDLFDVIQM